MARVYAPEPQPGPIELSLAGKTSAERASIKASALSTAKGTGYTFTLDGILVTLTAPPTITAGGKGVSFTLSASKAGVPLPLENPYVFVNPPVKVHNDTWRVVDGNDYKNYAEDVVAALQRMILDAVLLIARRKGWVG